MPKTLDDLREHLFATLEALRDKTNPMDIDRAKAISEISQTVINSAKAEVDYVKALGRQDLSLPVFGAEQKLEGTPGQQGIAAVRTHRIK